jgi:predicted metal-dependent hydrolase
MPNPTIVLTGNPPWAADLEAAASSLGYALKQYTGTESYIPRLADDHAALILVDGENPGWRFWITSPRVNAATRRIPIGIVTEEWDRQQAGLGSGADFALAPGDLAGRLPDLIAEHARVTEESYHAEMRAQCDQPLPERAREAIEKFNRGEYYRQHDLFEAQWVEEAGPVRDLYRAVLQIGIAYYQVTRNNPRGALKMLLRSVQWLNLLPDVCQGVDVARLREDALRLRAVLEMWPEGRDLADLDPSLLGKVHLVHEPRTGRRGSPER